MQSTEARRTSAAVPDTRFSGPIQANWTRFLRFWGPAGGLAMAGLFVAFPILESSSTNSPLLPRYQELAYATANPGLYQLASAFDVAVWLALGGMFVAFGALLASRAKVRATLITACGIGQVAGAIGAFTRLEGMTTLAADYSRAGPEQQAELLRSSLDLQVAINTHFAAGSVLWTMALFLVASVGWRMEHFPRWLAVVMGATGTLNLTADLFGIVSTEDVPMGLSLLALTGLMVVFFSVGQAFRRKTALATVGSTPADL